MSATRSIQARTRLPAGVEVTTKHHCEATPMDFATFTKSTTTTGAEAIVFLDVAMNMPEAQALATAKVLRELADDIERAAGTGGEK